MGYVDMLMMNYPLDTTESDQSMSEYESYNMYGGAMDKCKFGGFPIIVECKSGLTKKDIIEEKKQNEERAYETHKTSVSIKDIMEQRREKKPFFSL